MSESTPYIVAIPARYASTRLSGKPLVLVDGCPMIAQVCRKALQTKAARVIACVDDERVAEALAPFVKENPRLEVCMTSQRPRSGTERIAEMITTLQLDPETVIVNVQGDEPLIEKEHIDAVAEKLIDSKADMSTLVAPITEIDDVFDPNCVKAVLDAKDFALYFSRAPIPYERDNFMQGREKVTKLTATHYHHIGIYGYKAGTVLDYLGRESAELETTESLEQLRLLHYGMRIAVVKTDCPPEVGVDTAQDLERVNRILEARRQK